MLALLLPLAWAETLYANTTVEATRWPDTTLVTLELETGDVVEVVTREGGKVRVRRGLSFGWVPEATLVATPPEGEPALDLSLPAEPATGGQP